MILPERPMSALICVLSAAVCGCVPWPRDTLVRPEGTVEVVDAASMQPVPDARVVLVRYRVGPPPRIVSKTWQSRTGGDGKVKFTLLRRREWVYPLMCHGVDQWGWSVHVERKGYRPATVSWVVPRPMHDPDRAGHKVPHLVVKIVKCDGKCGPSPQGGEKARPSARF